MAKDNKENLARSVFSKGIDAYKAQCADGGTLLTHGADISERDLYAYPPTPRDQDGYGDFKSSADFNARVIIARLRTEDNRAMFSSPADKANALQVLMSNTISNIAVKELAEEILQAYGELEKDVTEVTEDGEPVEYEQPLHNTPGFDEALGNSELQ